MRFTQTEGQLLLLAPLVAAAVPALVPWRWFFVVVVAVTVAEAALFYFAAESLAPETGHGGDGPASLGMAVYIGAVFLVLALAVSLRPLTKSLTWLYKRFRASQAQQSARVRSEAKMVTPNPSLERTATGKSPWPRGAEVHVAPRGQGAMPPSPAQLKR